MKSFSCLFPCLLLVVGQPGLWGDPYEVANKAIAELLSPAEATLCEDTRLYRLFDIIFAWRLEDNPIHATYVGVTDFNDRWPDMSLAAIERRKEQDRRFLAALEKIRSADLSEQALLDWQLVSDDYRERIEGQRFPEELLAINQLNGPQQTISNLLNMMPRRSVADYEDILARLASADSYVLSVIPLLRKGVESGVTPARITLRNLPAQFDALVLEDPTQTPFWKVFLEMPTTISENEGQRIRAEAARLISGPVRSAYLELRTYLESEYIPNTCETIAMYDLPDGEAWYAFAVKETTTTDLSPAEIHEIGDREVHRIQAEIMDISREAGFEGSFLELRDFLHTDPQFFYETAEDLMNGFLAVCKRADPEMVKLFGNLPRLPYGIVETPAHLAPSAPGGQYMAGSMESGRAGYFYLNTYNLKSRPKWMMEPLALHETVPGHHLQIAIARELDQLHVLRRHQRYTAFSEGWALYSERLGYDMGMYKDPWSRIGQRASEIFRAVRLVVDTGLHAKGWSRDQAITFFEEHSLALPHETVVEVDRYIVWPTQALAYKIGQLEILRLREYAESTLGDKFDIRAFHDKVLGNGALPLHVLEAQVHKWVDGQI